MAQNRTVMAFRKRLANRGYKNISIKKLKGMEAVGKPNTYRIRAIEPLAEIEVIAEYTTTKMNYTFR